MSITGVVQWFDINKGYGFIKPDNGGRDVFVHVRSLEKCGISTLNKEDKVSYEIEINKERIFAVNLKLL